MSQESAYKAARYYDQIYQKDNYFELREWLYRPYVKALVSRLRLKKGSTILDAGCGQGLFTRLFANEGLSAFGADISRVAIQKAKEKYPDLADRFFVMDVDNPTNGPQVDCVFVRCCSLYNNPEFRRDLSPTLGLLELLRPGGVLVFTVSTNLSRKGKSWMNHNLADARDHFGLSDTSYDLYFINKIDTLITGRRAFNKLFTVINALAAKVTGLSGEIIVLARKKMDNAIGSV